MKNEKLPNVSTPHLLQDIARVAMEVEERITTQLLATNMGRTSLRSLRQNTTEDSCSI